MEGENTGGVVWGLNGRWSEPLGERGEGGGGVYQQVVRGEASVQHSVAVHMSHSMQHCLAMLQQGRQSGALSSPPGPPGGLPWGAPAPSLLPAATHDSHEAFQAACSSMRGGGHAV